MISRALAEASKCTWCGFCEYVCPTYNVLRQRHYGPRGRLALLTAAYERGNPSSALLRAVYVCLLCGACNTVCPANIDVVEAMRIARAYLVQTSVRGKG